MKRLQLLYIALIYVACIHGQVTKAIKLSYDLHDFDFELRGEIMHIESHKYSISYDSDSLTPALPYIYIDILLDRDLDYNGLSFTYSEKEAFNNIIIESNKIEIPTSDDITSGASSHYQYSSAIYPTSLIEYQGHYTVGGYKIATLKVSPFIYYPRERKLNIVDSIQITLYQKEADTILRRSKDRLLMNRIKGNVSNASEITFSSSSEPSLSSEYKYLIITDTIMAPAFQRLVNWKTTKGVRAKILTIDKIDSLYNGETRQIRIKKAIIDHYDGQYQGLEYVLLGGDISVIPTQSAYIKYSSYTEYAPADLYYSCMGSLNWDSNGNGIAGEISDSIQIAPDIIVSRIPVTSLESANVFVKRIIDYEAYSDTDDWHNNILTCGKKISYYNIVGNDSISDAQQKGEYLYNHFIQPYWNGERIRFYDTQTDFEGGKDYDLTSEHLQTELEKGYSMVYINTHGSPTTWQMEIEKGHPSYHKSSAMALSVNNPTIIITDACSTNAFDYNNVCLSEAFIQNPAANVISYIGSSREGWSVSSPEYSQQLFKNLLQSDTKQLGPAFYAMKSHFVGSCFTYGNPKRWLLFSINMLGDPETPMYLSKPNKIDITSLTSINDSLLIQIGIDSCRVCIMSMNDFGESFYHVEENVNTYSCSNITSDVCVCITKPGYIPWIAYIFNNEAYIQNEIFKGDIHIIARNTFIGSDVSSIKENGPVNIQKGKTTIKSTNGVTIKNDFEIEIGSEFEINVN